jgi:hypothetical protein
MGEPVKKKKKKSKLHSDQWFFLKNEV